MRNAVITTLVVSGILYGCAKPAPNRLETAPCCALDLVSDAHPDQAATGIPLSDEAIHSPAVRAALARSRAAKLQVDEIAAGRLPALTVFGEAGIDSTVTGNFDASVTGQPYSYGVAVSMPVYDNGRINSAEKAQSARAEAARYAAHDTLAGTIFDLALAIATRERADRLIAARNTELGTLNSLYSEATTSLEAGLSSQLDLTRIELRANQTKLVLSNARTAREAANANYQALTGRLPNSIDQIKSLSASLPKTRAAAMEIALLSNPQLQLALYNAAAGRSDLDLSKAERGGNLDLLVSAVGEGSLDTLGSSGPLADTYSASARVRFELPINAGNEVRVERSQQEALAAELDATATEQRVLADIDQTFDRIEAARQDLQKARLALGLADKVAKGVRRERELGDRTYSDVLDAEAALADARVQAEDASYTLVITEHLLALQTGLLTELYKAELNFD